MIKFRATNEKDEEVLGIGLSRENCERLLAGHPIGLRPDAMGIAWPGEIVILAGETEEGLTHELHAEGMLEGARIFGFDPDKEQKP